MTHSADSFEFLRRFLEERTGIVLEEDQRTSVESRLIPLAQRHGGHHLDWLIERLCDNRVPSLSQEVVEALATHETSFFRDAHYFDELAERVLPSLIAQRAAERRLRIWCAACSSGQEPYSLAMLLAERFSADLHGWNVELVATDLSARCLEQARDGKYSDVEISRGLLPTRLDRHFRREPPGWRIHESLRRMIRFQQVNLIAKWPTLPPFDLVLLRNVLIYLNTTSRQSILDRLREALRPDGCAMFGSTESSFASNHGFTCVRPTASIPER